MTIIGDVCHLVRAETIGFCDGIEFTPYAVCYDQTAISFHLHLKATVQFFSLGDIFQDDIFIRRSQSLQ